MLLPDDGWGLEGWVASKSSSSSSVSRLEALALEQELPSGHSFCPMTIKDWRGVV